MCNVSNKIYRDYQYFFNAVITSLFILIENFYKK